MAEAKPSQYCTFSGVTGLDRILQMQSFWPHSPDGSERLFYSWPVPEPKEQSCNIVILGKPGTGKTTLALALASSLRTITPDGGPDKRATGPGEPTTVVYYSLEQSPRSLITRTEKMQKGLARHVEGPRVAEGKYRVDGPIPAGMNVVLYPKLSPRRLEQTGEQSDDSSIFWQRLSEIRTLIDLFPADGPTSPKLISESALPRLRMVVLDSLSVFGDKPISRYLIEQLFSVFEEKGIIGVFVAEDPESAQSRITDEPLISPGISYLADAVIRLDWKEDQGYLFRTVEVSKSRQTRNVNGPQQMKLTESGAAIFPSLHSWYSFITAHKGTGNPGEDEKATAAKLGALSNRVRFGYDCIDKPIQNYVKDKGSNPPSVVHTILGERHVHKTKIALSFARLTAPGKFLVVSLGTNGDRADMERHGIYHAQDQSKLPESMKQAIPENKGRLIGLSLKEDSTDIDGYQLWMAPGYLLPEELVHFMHEVLTRGPRITRVVVEDIGQIPVRYPVIARQIKDYCNFFAVMIELFRTVVVDCCFVCTTGVPNSDQMTESLTNVSHGFIEVKRNKACASKISFEYRGSYADGYYAQGELPPWETPQAR